MKSPFAKPVLTPSCERILQRFASFMVGDETADVGHLVLAVLTEESLGGKLLNDLGITIAGIADGCFGEQAAGTAMVLIAENLDLPAEIGSSAEMPAERGNSADLPWLISLRDRAARVARHSDSGNELSSTHLLQAMVDLPGPAKQQLAQAGVTRQAVLEELFGHAPNAHNDWLPVDFELSVETNDAVDDSGNLPTTTPHTRFDVTARILAVIDANLNRAREGLRVLEDCSRFVLHDRAATSALKQLRHDLVAIEQQLRNEQPQLLLCRNIDADVGTSLTTDAEMRREQFGDLVTANARRLQESLRSLEEFGKTVSGPFAAAIKQLRYRSYELEQRLAGDAQLLMVEDPEWFPDPAANTSMTPPPQTQEATGEFNDRQQKLRRQRRTRLHSATLYVLVTEEQCRRPWKDVVTAALQGGADVIQLREKQLNDDELLRRSHWMAAACRDAGALFILNDRADLAAAARADGVHIGQQDASVVAVRSHLHDGQLLGVSTHHRDDVIQACAAGADYLGVGPVFASVTKSFHDFPGLAFVRQASQHADRPWFAIGGIQQTNLAEVQAHGATRIAVSNAVIGCAAPEQAARELRRSLNSPEPLSPETVPFPNS